MRTRDRALLAVAAAMLSLTIGIGIRFLVADAVGFGAQDLERFSSTTGIDLPDAYADHPFLLTWSRGDGQVFLTLAADPLAQGPARRVLELPYRYTRIGYSLLASGSVAGIRDALPLGLLIVNTTAMLALGAIAGWKHPDWGIRSLMIPISPAVIIGFVYDTAEVLAVLTIVLSVVGYKLAAGWGFLLGMTRPSYLTGLLLSPRWISGTIAAVVATLGVRLFAVTALDLGWAGSAGTLAPPFAGYVAAWPQQGWPERLVTWAVALTAVWTVVVAWRRRSKGHWAFAAASSALLVLLVSAKVVVEPVNLLRSTGPLLLAWLIPLSATEAEKKAGSRNSPLVKP